MGTAASITTFTPLALTERADTGFAAIPQEALWHPDLALAYRSLPGGETSSWGVPLIFVPADAPARWIWLSDGLAQAVTISIDARADRLVIAHFAVPSTESVEIGSPGGLPSGLVAHPGEHLANYALGFEDGFDQAAPIRRRFEINDVLIAWGQLAFRARPHQAIGPANWRGPHAAGGWGEDQTGVRMAGSVMPVPRGPRAGLRGNYWVFSLENPRPDESIRSLRLESVAGTVAVAALTLFSGPGDPLVHRALESVLIDTPGRGTGDQRSDEGGAGISVDLGVVARVFPVAAIDGSADTERHRVGRGATPGWGAPRPGWASLEGALAEPSGAAPASRTVVELAAAETATLSIGREAIPIADLRETGSIDLGSGARVRLLPPADRWVTVTVRDESGRPTPSRVHFAAADGRYLPPLGHRHEVNDRWFEDYGADLQLGVTSYAYVPGTFRIQLPVGDVFVEAVKGFEYEPLRRTFDLGPGDEQLDLSILRRFDARREGWLAADTHVHFVSPDTARLEARAEGVDVVNLLATQWGDLFTNIGDFTGRASRAPYDRLDGGDADVIVWVGTENRQHLLGHLSSLGLSERLPAPLTSSGPDESGIGDPTWTSLAEWSDECRRQGGIVVIPHFPEPFSEVVADVVLGKVDAVEIRDFAWGVDSFGVREWYRLLNCGYRVPVVGGTDKMSAGIPIGGVRTYTQLEDADELDFGRWQDGVRAGRSITTSGPFLTLTVDGRGLGEEVAIGAVGTIDVEARAVSVQPVTVIEIVHNGRVVARSQSGQPDGTRDLRLVERLSLAPGWIAARCWGSGTLWHEWPMRVAAHTSPIYLTGASVAPPPSDVEYLATILDGGLAWLDTLATRADPRRHERVRNVFIEARRLVAP